MKKYLVVFVLMFVFAGLASAGEKLTDKKLHTFMERMEFVGNVKLDGQIDETFMVETWVDGVVYQILYDSTSQFVTVKVSDLKAHSILLSMRGLTDEQFTKDVVYFYLNSDTLSGEKVYKI